MASFTNFPNGVTSFGIPIVGNGYAPFPNKQGNVWFVDGTYGSDGYEGTSVKRAFATIQAAVTKASASDTIYILPKVMAAGATDPVSYAETIIIPAATSNLSLIGVARGNTQGGLPQIKKGSGSTALLTIRAPGCLIANLGFNGSGSTGGGILLDDDGSTKSAFGTTITGCHFKNCRGSSATNAATGGAIQWASTGGAWQVRIENNRFYKNVGDIVLLGTSLSVPEDVVIKNNSFSDSAAVTDCNLYLAAGSGMVGLTIRENAFGAIPAVGSGTNATYAVLTNCTGTMTDCNFGCSGKTFGATGNIKVPTTVLMANNYQEPAAGASGEIGRT